MLSSIIAALNPIKAITDSITQYQIEKMKTNNDERKLELDAEIAALTVKRDAMIAASQNDKWYSPRSLMGYSVVAYVGKTVVWDTVLGLGVTPDPGQMVWWLVVTIVGFYFVSRSAETITNGIANVLARKYSPTKK